MSHIYRRQAHTHTSALRGDQTHDIWISRLYSIPVQSNQWRGLPIISVNFFRNFGDSCDFFCESYGYSRFKVLWNFGTRNYSEVRTTPSVDTQQTDILATSDWVMSHMNDSCHTYTGVTHERFMSLIYRGRAHTHTEIVNLQVSTYTGVTQEHIQGSHMNDSCHTWTIHVTRIQGSSTHTHRNSKPAS